MNMKKEIKFAFKSPEPTGKTEFLRSLDFPKASRFDFILAQAGYIRKRVWILSCVLIALLLAALRFYDSEDSFRMVWVVSAVSPFVELIAITEIMRSQSCKMEELEMTCKFSLADVVMIRLCILSSVNLVMFCISAVALNRLANISFIMITLYLLSPFMLTCALSVFVINRMRSRETVYVCGGIAGFVSLISSFAFSKTEMFNSDRYLLLWCAIFILLLIFVVREILFFARRLEELQWNWSLTA